MIDEGALIDICIYASVFELDYHIDEDKASIYTYLMGVYFHKVLEEYDILNFPYPQGMELYFSEDIMDYHEEWMERFNDEYLPQYDHQCNMVLNAVAAFAGFRKYGVCLYDYEKSLMPEYTALTECQKVEYIAKEISKRSNQDQMLLEKVIRLNSDKLVELLTRELQYAHITILVNTDIGNLKQEQNLHKEAKQRFSDAITIFEDLDSAVIDSCIYNEGFIDQHFYYIWCFAYDNCEEFGRCILNPNWVTECLRYGKLLNVIKNTDQF